MTAVPSIKKPAKGSAKHRGVIEKVPGSGIWWVQYFDSEGRRHREKVGRKQAAIDLYKIRKAAILEGAKLPANLRQPGEKLSVILNRALEWYGSHRPKALKHATTHVNAIKADLGDRQADKLTPDDVDKWLGSHKDWKPATANRHKATLSKALQLAVISGKLDRNVARLVPARRENNARVRWLKDDEEKRLLTVMEKKYPEQLPALMIAIHTGMRASEQFSLEWSEIDLKRRKISLDNTKNGSDREVPMNDTCHQLLEQLWKKRQDHIKEGKTTTQWVFPPRRSEGKLLYSPRSWFEDALVEAKIKDLHWHDLRHTFISRLVMKGVNLRTVMELAGHKSITMTTRYAHLAPENNVQAIKLLDKPPEN